MVAIPATGVVLRQGKSKSVSIFLDDIDVNVIGTTIWQKIFRDGARLRIVPKLRIFNNHVG